MVNDREKTSRSWCFLSKDCQARASTLSLQAYVPVTLTGRASHAASGPISLIRPADPFGSVPAF